jgi:hypothetical protein
MGLHALQYYIMPLFRKSINGEISVRNKIAKINEDQSSFAAESHKKIIFFMPLSWINNAGLLQTFNV